MTGFCIEDYNSITGEYCGEWAGATLRKLPVFGLDDALSANEIDFEWPTKEIFD